MRILGWLWRKTHKFEVFYYCTSFYTMKKEIKKLEDDDLHRLIKFFGLVSRGYTERHKLGLILDEVETRKVGVNVVSKT